MFDEGGISCLTLVTKLSGRTMVIIHVSWVTFFTWFTLWFSVRLSDGWRWEAVGVRLVEASGRQGAGEVSAGELPALFLAGAEGGESVGPPAAVLYLRKIIPEICEV